MGLEIDAGCRDKYNSYREDIEYNYGVVLVEKEVQNSGTVLKIYGPVELKKYFDSKKRP